MSLSKYLQLYITYRLEFITNLMHNFIYSIIILHHDQHVSSIAVLILGGHGQKTIKLYYVCITGI
jgi:hypothetical protein